MNDLPEQALSSLEITFYVPRTPTRLKRLAKIVKALHREADRHNEHWFASSFLPTAGNDYYLYVHVDEDIRDDGSKHLYVEVKFRPLPTGSAPQALAAQPQRADWAFAELTALIGSRPAFCFFDADVHLRDRMSPANAMALPLTIRGRPLPVIGIEYGSDEFIADGVTGFRWTRSRSGLRVKVTYVRDGSGVTLRDAWLAERSVVAKYVAEGLER